MWQMSEHDTRGRDTSTLAAMHALEQACKASGNNWRPSAIAGKLSEAKNAGSLVRLLEDGKIREFELEQDLESRTADRQRARFNLWLFLAVVASAGAAAAGGLMLWKGVTWDKGALGPVYAGAQLALVAVAWLFWLLLWRLQPYHHWLVARGRAEELRQEIFSHVLNEANRASRTESTEKDKPSVRQFALEYLRVCLLDHQIGWFRNKSKIARSQGVLLGILRVAGLALLMLAMAMSSVGGLTRFQVVAIDIAVLPPFARWIAARLQSWFADSTLTVLVSILGTSAMTAAQTADSALLSGRNRARYREMANSLEKLRTAHMAKAQTAAARPAPDGTMDDAMMFETRLREVLAIEQAEWRAVVENNSRYVSTVPRQLNGG
jgi:hypothetical protein